jgi:tRNA modification GTPase
LTDHTTNQDTIAALATPPGRGGIGIIRISGAKALEIGKRITGEANLTPRYAHYGAFYDQHGEVLDQGICLYFKNPNSFTGEDVVELQGHGGPVIMDLLLKTVVSHGTRVAKPGEFSERAYLNDKIDLAQAEAIVDLINSSTEQAARGAMRSLNGEFSHKINDLLSSLIELRMYVEAAIDFPEEEIDFLQDESISSGLSSLIEQVQATIQSAGQGRILRQGIRVCIAGKPNAGKSSLLNALTGEDKAIVTDIAGTTRDIISETIDLDGLPVHIIDTAGLRQSSDQVEQHGIARARAAIIDADHIIYLVDATESKPVEAKVFFELQGFSSDELNVERITTIHNKTDLLEKRTSQDSNDSHLYISAKTGDGVDELREKLKSIAGYQNFEGTFTARRRHLAALETALTALLEGQRQLGEFKAGEILAEELLQAQNALSEITGEFSADDLLGEIFSGFCIGK